jgi:hypothetical protein
MEGVNLFLILGIAALTLTGSIFYFRSVSTKCDDGNVCTADYLTGNNGHCESYPYPNTKRCQTNCLIDDATSSYCNVKTQSCIPRDATECKAHCTMDDATNILEANGTHCNDLFPLREFLTYDFLDGETESVNNRNHIWASTANCIANQCMRLVLQVSFSNETNSPSPLTGYMGAYLDCDSLLETNQTDVDLTCIKSREIEVSQDLISADLNTEFGSNTFLKWEPRACVYHYSCGSFNTTAFGDYYEVVEAKRSLSQGGSDIAALHHNPEKAIVHASLQDLFSKVPRKNLQAAVNFAQRGL